MFDYKEYVDYHATLAFLVRYYVFVVFFGLSAIAFWLPDYKKHKLSIITIVIILVILYIVNETEVDVVEIKV